MIDFTDCALERRTGPLKEWISHQNDFNRAFDTVHTWKATQKCDRDSCYCVYPRAARSQPAQSAVNGRKWVSAANHRQSRHWNHAENTPATIQSELTGKSLELLNEWNEHTGLIHQIVFVCLCVSVCVPGIILFFDAIIISLLCWFNTGERKEERNPKKTKRGNARRVDNAIAVPRPVPPGYNQSVLTVSLRRNCAGDFLTLSFNSWLEIAVHRVIQQRDDGNHILTMQFEQLEELGSLKNELQRHSSNVNHNLANQSYSDRLKHLNVEFQVSCLRIKFPNALTVETWIMIARSLTKTEFIHWNDFNNSNNWNKRNKWKYLRCQNLNPVK